MVSLPTRDAVKAIVGDIEARRIDANHEIQVALRQFDPDAALAFLLASGATGRKVSATLVAELIPHIPNPWVMPLVVSCCDGDRVTMLLDLVEAKRLSYELQSVALFLATELLEQDSPPPLRLTGLVRTLGRAHLQIESSILVAIVARRLDDPHVLEVVGPRVAMADTPDASRLKEELLELLDGSILDNLPERTQRNVVSGFTFRRTTAKVKPNDPCPCGSGKKHKKCCSSAAATAKNPLPSRADRHDALRAASNTLTPYQVRHLLPSDLAHLDPQGMSTLAVSALLQQASFRHQWETAEKALGALATRADLPRGCRVDEYRSDLIAEALEAGARDVATRHASLLEDRSLLTGPTRLGLAFLRDDVDLATIDELTLEALGDTNGEALIELAYTLLRSQPALGIPFARAALRADRQLDSHTLLTLVEEARDGLGLPPHDPAWDVWEQMLDTEFQRHREELDVEERDDARRELIERAERAREDLRHASGRIADLERELAQNQDPNTEVPASVEVMSQRQTDTPASADSNRMVRLKDKVRELKTRITEGNEQRKRLRAELADLSTQLEKRVDREPGATTVHVLDSELEAEGDGVAAPRAVLVPTIEKRVAAALGSLPNTVARNVLMVLAALACGNEPTWKQVKKLELANPPLLSARVGAHHRLLFAVVDGELCAKEIIHRKDLERTLRSYK